MRDLTGLLLAKRNQDGGWPYRFGSSWTEPTAFALLALSSARYRGREVDEGRKWIRQTQNGDGGWSTAPGIRQSCWVTNAALLALPDDDLSSHNGRKGLAWVTAQTSADPGLLARFVRFLNHDSSEEVWKLGAPWVPGASAWVAPTCLMLLLLRRATKLPGGERYESRMREGQKFLLARRLSDGGWNHGGAYVPGERVASYPETTGLALLALEGYDGQSLQSSVRLAEHMAPQAQSAEAWAWLRLGLAAQGVALRDRPRTELPAWTTVDLALLLLGQTAQLKSNPVTGGSYA
jgi:Prenyltransferase and squalene oxidase repeat